MRSRIIKPRVITPPRGEQSRLRTKRIGLPPFFIFLRLSPEVLTEVRKFSTAFLVEKGLQFQSSQSMANESSRAGEQAGWVFQRLFSGHG